MYRKTVYTFFITLFFFNACGSNSQDNFPLTEKMFLHELFLSEYLWYDQVDQEVDYHTFTTPQSMVNALRVSPPDLWSFTMTKEAYEDATNQKSSGFGFRYSSDFMIYTVRINSPAYNKLFRGDQIIKMNDQEISTELLFNASKTLGAETVFTVLRDDVEHEVNITAQEYTYNVALGNIIETENKHIAYLRFDSFTESAVSELEDIFTTFKENSIDELIIDLRYNGGGSLTTASIFLDNITNAYPGQRQFYLDWNENNQYHNSAYNFEEVDEQDGNELDISRVVFLVTSGSASASEALINALVPYLGTENVITIGSDTHGKPVGMSGRSYGENYYFLINFFVRNDDLQTTPFEGISVTCNAQDDLTHLLGDINEKMLKTALYYLKTGLCLE